MDTIFKIGRCILCMEELNRKNVPFPVCHEYNVCQHCAWSNFLKTGRRYCMICRRELNIVEFRALFNSKTRNDVYKYLSERILNDVYNVRKNVRTYLNDPIMVRKRLDEKCDTLISSLMFNSLKDYSVIIDGFLDGIRTELYSSLVKDNMGIDYSLRDKCNIYCGGDIIDCKCNRCHRTYCTFCDVWIELDVNHNCSQIDRDRSYYYIGQYNKGRAKRCPSCTSWIRSGNPTSWCNFCNVLFNDKHGVMPIGYRSESDIDRIYEDIEYIRSLDPISRIDCIMYRLRNHIILSEYFNIDIPLNVLHREISTIQIIYMISMELWGMHDDRDNSNFTTINIYPFLNTYNIQGIVEYMNSNDDIKKYLVSVNVLAAFIRLRSCFRELFRLILYKLAGFEVDKYKLNMYQYMTKDLLTKYYSHKTNVYIDQKIKSNVTRINSYLSEGPNILIIDY